MPPTECANPLFLKWLEELRDAAREKGHKVADVYNKGCRAIAACPVAYTRPVELAPLQGIGPKTIQLLDAKLKKHCQETGTLYPVSPPRPAPAAKRTKRGKEKEKDKDPMEEDDGSESERPEPKKRKARTPRPYIPAARSGPAGILIGMVVAAGDEPDEALTEQLTRGEIVRHAQPFCESSYDHSERGTWVTAWNGMKTLVNKGYVCVQGIPHRYCLTEAGFDIAAVLRNMLDEYKDGPQIIPLCQRGDDRDGPFDRPLSRPGPGPSTSTARGSPANANAPPPRASVPASRRVSSSRFGFWYLDSTGRRVEDVESARTRLDPTEFLTLRQIEFPESLKNHPIVQQLRFVDEDPTLHESGMTTLTAYFLEDEAPPKCSKFDDNDDLTPILPPAPTAAPSRPIPARTTALARTGSSRPRLSSQLPLPGEHRDSPDFHPSQSIHFAEGTYEIILILDTREIESRNNRDRISESLERKGVKVETRALRLGDMCWVARRLDAYGAEEDECVLDFVVERKRLDDLVSSIRDGRYSEQCFRLGQSGIGNVFYIVEDYQKAHRMQYQGKQIMTAKSQIQVINGFFLKETNKLSDTIDYLVIMTKVIKELTRDLHVIPSRYLSRTNYAALQTKLRETYPDRAFLTSYEAYQALNKKSNLRTAKEYLARMLLVVKGMSPERVSAVLDVWETPRQLYESMKTRYAQGVIGEGRKKRGPELMFADMVKGEGRRKIGDALSRALWYAMWGKDDAPVDGAPAPDIGAAQAAASPKSKGKGKQPAAARAPKKATAPPPPPPADSPPGMSLPPRVLTPPHFDPPSQNHFPGISSPRPSYPGISSPRPSYPGISSPRPSYPGISSPSQDFTTFSPPPFPASSPPRVAIPIRRASVTPPRFVPPPFPVSPARAISSPSAQAIFSPSALRVRRSRTPLFLASDSEDEPMPLARAGPSRSTSLATSRSTISRETSRLTTVRACTSRAGTSRAGTAHTPMFVGSDSDDDIIILD